MTNATAARAPALFREPLFQFLLLGAALFAGAGFFDPQRDGPERQVVIDAALERRLAKLYELQMGTPPARAQRDELIENYIHDEVLYREALSMGLDRDDEIIRRRLIQKLQFLNSDLASVPEPSEQALRAYYEANTSQLMSEPAVTFSHLYFNPDGAGSEAARRRAESARAELALPGASVEPGMGDPFPLQSTYAQIDRASAVQLFGRTPIVDELFSQPSGEWAGPFLSGYGWHLIQVTRRAEEAVQPFESVRERVRQIYLQQETQAANRKRYEQLRTRYAIVRATAMESE